jgi:hypothetical protein
MSTKAILAATAAQAAATGQPGGKLVLANKPKADTFQFFTVPAAQNGGVEVTKYTTRYGTTYEKHVDQIGITTWWKLVKPRPPKVAV